MNDLARAHEEIRADATRLAGGPGDMPQRVALLHAIFADSRGNHAFPEVALHGAPQDMVRDDDRDWIEGSASLRPGDALAEPLETGRTGADEINVHLRRSVCSRPVTA